MPPQASADRIAISAAVVAVAILAELLFAALPEYVLFLPAVLIASLIGGRWVGGAALLVTATFAAGGSLAREGVALNGWPGVGLGGFVAAGVLSIYVVDLYHKATARLARERSRLKVALEAAQAALWELSPDKQLYWDENFYRLVGLDPSATPPATPTFLEMIHPQDRHRLADARRLMDEGKEPASADEYRLTRPDGKTVWLENHRTRVFDGGVRFIGITQDVTRRKLAEERVQTLLGEADHRAKNQFAVIMAMARETSRKAPDSKAFDEAFGSRLQALARSHDLMVKGDWRGTTLRELILAHLEPFGGGSRCTLDGPEISVSPSAAQYLGMAFHELATNAVKHGPLAAEMADLRVAWEIREGSSGNDLVLTWREAGSAQVDAEKASGFGTKVLLELVPAALDGRSSREFTRDGVHWTLVAPVSAITATATPGSQVN